MTGVAKEAFQVLLRFNYVVKLFDADGMAVAEPSAARRMFAASPNLMVSLTDDDDNSSIKLLFSKSTHASEIDGLIQALRTCATKYNMTFEPKQYGKEIDAKDYKSLISVSESQKELEMHVCEGMYGTSRSSYLQLDHAKMIIHHKAPIDLRAANARAHHIDQIFVENAAGQRYPLVATDLATARKLTEHVDRGGHPADATGRLIVAEAEQAALATAVAEALRDQPKTGRRPMLAENNAVVRDFLQWTERFAPDRALLEFNDPYDPAEQSHESATEQAINDFDPREFMASDVYQDMLSGRGPMGDHDPTGEDSHLSKDEVLNALNHYLRRFIETHHGDFDDGFNGDTESLASAVYDRTAAAIEHSGLIIDDDADMLMPVDDGLEQVHPGDELTREDILLPNPHQGAGLARASNKAVVHDDPSGPDEEHLPDQFGDVSRLKSLAGIKRRPIS